MEGQRQSLGRNTQPRLAAILNKSLSESNYISEAIFLDSKGTRSDRPRFAEVLRFWSLVLNAVLLDWGTTIGPATLGLQWLVA